MEQKEVQFLVFLFSIVFFVLLTMIISLVSYFQKKKVQYILAQERFKAEYEEQLLRSRVEITEQHMKNMSWELHDNIGQLLSIASMQLKMVLHEKEGKIEEIKEVSAIIASTLEQVRSLSKNLNSEMIQNAGLRGSISDELDRLTRLGLLETKLDFDEDLGFSMDKEILIFRIIQEAISNVLRHSEAKLLSIVFKEGKNMITVLIKDDGSGYAENEVLKSTGMVNMTSRAKLLKGTLEFKTQIDIGTTISLCFPKE